MKLKVIPIKLSVLIVLLGAAFCFLSACSDNDKKSLLGCPKIIEDSLCVLIAGDFKNDTVVIALNGYQFFREVVNTEPSSGLTVEITTASDTIKDLTFILNGTDSLKVCPAPFLILNFIEEKLEIESLDSVPKLRFM